MAKSIFLYLEAKRSFVFSRTTMISSAELDTDIWYSEAFLCKRSLIIVNGFYTCYLIDGGICPLYVSLLSQKPFSLAGLHNQLEDGFLTSASITCKAHGTLKQIHNLNDQMPVVKPERLQKEWLNETTSKSTVIAIMSQPPEVEFRAPTVSKKFLSSDGTAKVNDEMLWAMPQQFPKS